MPLMTYSGISCPGLANSVKIPNTKVIFLCSHFAIYNNLIKISMHYRVVFWKMKTVLSSSTQRWFLGSSHPTKFWWRGDSVQACTRQGLHGFQRRGQESTTALTFHSPKAFAGYGYSHTAAPPLCTCTCAPERMQLRSACITLCRMHYY